MPQITKLSEIANEIDRLIHNGFAGKTFWITAEISSVKKIASKRWCFLDFLQTDENGFFMAYNWDDVKRRFSSLA